MMSDTINTKSGQRTTSKTANEIDEKNDPIQHTTSGKTNGKSNNKTDIIKRALMRKRGASLVELGVLTGWQPHSIRGYISGTLRKKQKFNIVAQITKSGTRRYCLIANNECA